MWLSLCNNSGNFVGFLNMDRVDLIRPVVSETGGLDTITITQGTATRDFKISHTAFMELSRYLDRYGII